VPHVLILLPPSEGKHSPPRGKPLDLSELTFPELAEARAAVLDELVRRCRQEPDAMLEVLGLGPRQADAVTRDASLTEAPTARADRIYTGVLYDALDLPGLDAPSRRRATRWLLIASGLFGVVGPADRIPAYRLSGDVRLPTVGSVARHWARHLAEPLAGAAGDRLVVDLRSSSYVPFWRPGKAHAEQVATVRVLHEQDGRRSVVSHFNKATKGRIVRALLQDGGVPRRPPELAEQLRALGWHVEPHAARAQAPVQLDVVVTSLT
jgi:uncharacterized protein